MVEPTTPTVDLSSVPVRSSLRVKVLGTLIAGLAEYSVASVQDCVTLKSQTYSVGDKIQDKAGENSFFWIAVPSMN